MSRKIKFRTWDTQNKEYSEWTNRDPFFDTSHGQIFFWERVRKEDGSYDGDIILEDLNNRFILQQFTGLTDAEDKEIFEGDLLELEPAYEGMPLEYDFVRWNDGAWKVHGGYLSDFTNCKIVGNMCETFYVHTHRKAILDDRVIKEFNNE